MLGWIVHKQVNMVVFAVDTDQLDFKIGTDPCEVGSQMLHGLTVKDPFSVFCDQDQVNV
jgi:hypothetical protein